ncbi:MAG: cation transporter [Bacteroidales bacterium]|nr:cation transporter [Bacteroidales bacterium]
MANHHPHQHSPAHSLQGKKLFWSVLLNIFITVAQLIGGFLANSLSLLTDALHNFSDVLSLLISWFAHKLTHKPATAKRTFGYQRAEIVAAFINASSLLIIAFFLFKEAIERFSGNETVQAGWIILLGLLSILINGISVLLLSKDAKNSLNIHSAYLHLFTDMMTSVAVVIGGLVIYFWNWYWVDPLLTIIIAIYLIFNSWKVLSDALKILMLFTPAEVDLEMIKALVLQFPEIKNLHHLHVWALNDTQTHLEAHLSFAKNFTLAESNSICSSIESALKNHFSIQHITLQAEYKPDCRDELISH